MLPTATTVGETLSLCPAKSLLPSSSALTRKKGRCWSREWRPPLLVAAGTGMSHGRGGSTVDVLRYRLAEEGPPPLARCRPPPEKGEKRLLCFDDLRHPLLGNREGRERLRCWGGRSPLPISSPLTTTVTVCWRRLPEHYRRRRKMEVHGCCSLECHTTPSSPPSAASPLREKGDAGNRAAQTAVNHSPRSPLRFVRRSRLPSTFHEGRRGGEIRVVELDCCCRHPPLPMSPSLDDRERKEAEPAKKGERQGLFGCCKFHERVMPHQSPDAVSMIVYKRKEIPVSTGIPSFQSWLNSREKPFPPDGEEVAAIRRHYDVVAASWARYMDLRQTQLTAVCVTKHASTPDLNRMTTLLNCG
nr:hypothetical protein Iba_chr09fCG11400 [Ipomoea batatas]